MRASRSDGKSKQPAAAALSPRLEAFLEMLAAERGAARLTLAAYRNDLSDLSGFLAARGMALETAESATHLPSRHCVCTGQRFGTHLPLVYSSR